MRIDEDELIDQALDDGSDPWFAGMTRERLEREGHVALALPVNECGRGAAVLDARSGSGRRAGGGS